MKPIYLDHAATSWPKPPGVAEAVFELRTPGGIEHRYMRAIVLQAASTISYRRRKPLDALAIMRAGVSSLPHPHLRQRLLKTLLDLPFSFMK